MKRRQHKKNFKKAVGTGHTKFIEVATSYPCQQLYGGTGDSIYHNVDGMCKHPECNPVNREGK